MKNYNYNNNKNIKIFIQKYQIKKTNFKTKKFHVSLEFPLLKGGKLFTILKFDISRILN